MLFLADDVEAADDATELNADQAATDLCHVTAGARADEAITNNTPDVSHLQSILLTRAVICFASHCQCSWIVLS